MTKKDVSLDDALKDYNSLRQSLISFLKSYEHSEHIKLHADLDTHMTKEKFESMVMGGSYVGSSFFMDREAGASIDKKAGVDTSKYPIVDSYEYNYNVLPKVKEIVSKSKYFYLNDEAHKGPHRPYIASKSDVFIKKAK